jgi:protein-tyrosine-phosphatase
MTPEARKALKSCGERVSRKPRPNTQFEDWMITEFDHIVCMTEKHAQHVLDAKDCLRKDIPKHAKIYTLGSIDGYGDIFDPWMCPQEVYNDVCKLIQHLCEELYKEIIK